MTGPFDPFRDRDELRLNADDILRNELLLDGTAMCIPMAQVTAIISRENLADNVAAHQDLVLRTIRSLLDDGLMKIGDIFGASDERVVPWDLSIDAAMDRVRDLFVDHYDEPDLYDFRIWLQLNPAGEQAARALMG
ncbi:hypothetical protein MSTO_56670 [Mycobacterium stomatepiae]|uniref:Uncharacterized protein n=1 Tax=Mycobacterium stomatepiae TaxID=470076 RepID=A0A7I7QH01_9MYCO|nr:hypothetical protein MSTO_56670 [Mycobacterium stomatepiae]